ncbi:hypothetical protein RvY_14002 [Ramazzottius varieornatus]|uniref:Mediator of RNA polymerase II transcription subunit 18 n=1 Tax=Ramazzottius varieornatus TaxID=947166 RepID=A0A1D1VRX4_RAMVA|nr:hypothetical protein RvY_14002 [Ramazzottius varieornatus]
MDPDLKIAAFNNIPNQEYALFGSVLEAHLETLLHRLKGLCGQLPGNAEPFQDHYLIYSTKSPNIIPPVHVRAVRSIMSTFMPWRFQYYGSEISEASRMVTQRQIIDACCSVRLPKFLEDGLGFNMDYEYILKGFTFAKGRVRISVGRMMKTAHEVNMQVEAAEALSGSYLVEVATVVFGGSATNEENPEKEILQVAELLKPIVDLKRLDVKR